MSERRAQRSSIARVVLVVFVAAVLSSCSLLGPSPRRIVAWLELPEPGEVYTYRTTTTWHDGSESEEERSYLVERVAEDDTGRLIIKFADVESDGLEAFFWVLDPELNAVYESEATTIADTDLLLLRAPVEERAEWSFGSIDYEISRTGVTVTTAAGAAEDAVTVDLEYRDESDTGISGLDGEVRWSPTFGLISYTEEYSSGYLQEVVRELVSVTGR